MAVVMATAMVMVMAVCDAKDENDDIDLVFLILKQKVE